ncbi:hypothetical protein PACTADRAFT_50936 [Pachysolen tannophilus NRRL Y-2460]|uniref:Ribosomal protein/NADH dehydrogenase domain-containing protein n=1 Tax=Pachysolen tannophilus NRRL Y-2460 TaxID=669874 RepID=A0A1E4TQL8_PACTA|nr:hypothetical protein PACTADRAFT_50936 [Pachysolen tannophilus NRRL Y-2460]
MASTVPKMFKNLPNGRFTKQVARLNLISNYPSSAIKLPSTISSIDLIFKRTNSAGHMGPRKFWRNNLPTVQFHNPNIPITVTRIETESKDESEKCPATLTINYQDGQKKLIDLKYKHSDEILKEFTEITQAQVVEENDIPTIKYL